jgi:hypothetical protein
VALSIVEPPLPQPNRTRQLGRWELLIYDALRAFEHQPGGMTCKDICDFITPRLSWHERWWVHVRVYPVLYAMCDLGWLADTRVERGAGYTLVYSIKRVPNGD